MVCKELNANTEEERVMILEAMDRGGEVEGVTESPNSKEEYIKHLAKHFKVLQIKGDL